MKYSNSDKQKTPVASALLLSAKDLSRLVRSIFDIAMDIILILDADGHILEANQKAIDSYAYSREELLQKRILDIRHPSTCKDYEQQMIASESQGVFFENLHCRKDRSCFPVEVSSRSISIEGQLLRVHIIRDISERKKAEEKMNRLAHYDMLTGLENRASIMDRFNDILAEAAKSKHQFAVMIIDLDKFKLINDNYGHLFGDEVLQQSAQRFRRALRQSDHIGRYGGDEFLLLQASISDKNDIKTLVERIFSEFELTWAIDGFDLDVHLSVGISIYPSDAKDRDELIKQADRAMYQAKKTYGNSFVFAEQL